MTLIKYGVSGAGQDANDIKCYWFVHVTLWINIIHMDYLRLFEDLHLVTVIWKSVFAME